MWCNIKKKVLVLGVSGLTGYKIAKQANSSFEIYGTYNSRPVKIENSIIFKLNLEDEEEIKKIFSEVKPDLVINTTALHNVDFCEENQENATRVNTKAVQFLYQNSEKYGSKLIHISTDYVFDGLQTSPYTENDIANPLSFYGKSKLDGEKILSGTSHVVIRPSVVYGWTPLELAGTTSSSGKPMNFALWVLTKLHSNEPLKIVTDQFASATLADSLAESILKISQSKTGGIFHVSGLSCESRFDFTIKLAKKFGYDESLISPVSASEFKQKAKRPAFSCLNCQKATDEFGLKLLSTDESLDIMKNQVKHEAPHLLADNKWMYEFNSWILKLSSDTYLSIILSWNLCHLVSRD